MSNLNLDYDISDMTNESKFTKWKENFKRHKWLLLFIIPI